MGPVLAGGSLPLEYVYFFDFFDMVVKKFCGSSSGINKFPVIFDSLSGRALLSSKKEYNHLMEQNISFHKSTFKHDVTEADGSYNDRSSSR
jgi:hypothetical protein